MAGLDDLPDDLLEIGDARGPRQRTAPPQVEVIRSLGADDLHLLTAPLPEAAPAKPLSRLKHSHHEAARLMAIGTPDVEDLALHRLQQRLSVYASEQRSSLSRSCFRITPIIKNKNTLMSLRGCDSSA